MKQRNKYNKRQDCLKEFNVRQHYNASKMIGHSLWTTQTNELGFTVPSFPWKSTHPTTNRGRRALTFDERPIELALVATVNS